MIKVCYSSMEFVLMMFTPYLMGILVILIAWWQDMVHKAQKRRVMK